MNKGRRKQLVKAATLIHVAEEALTEAREIIQDCHTDEEEYFNCMPENFQEGEKGDVAQAALDALDEAMVAIDEFDIAEIENALNTASE